MVNQIFIPITFTADPTDNALPPTDLKALYTGGAFLPPLLSSDDPNRRGYQLIGASANPGSFMLLLIYLQPHSQGKVRIQTSDPLTVSLADNNYFGDPQDLQAFIAALRQYILPLANSFTQLYPQYQLVSPSVDVINDDDLVRDFIYDNFDHTHHWMSSNIMSTTPATDVVNGFGSVYGVKHLTIADDSIAPIMNDGNTCAPAYLIAWIISTLLLKFKK